MTFLSSGYMTKSCIFSTRSTYKHKHRHADTRTGRLECWTNCFAACQCPKERAGRSEGAEAGQGKRKWGRTKREEDENERKNAGTKQAWSCWNVKEQINVSQQTNEKDEREEGRVKVEKVERAQKEPQKNSTHRHTHKDAARNTLAYYRYIRGLLQEKKASEKETERGSFLLLLSNFMLLIFVSSEIWLF